MAYSKAGPLVVTGDRVVFGDGGDSVEISVKAIVSVSLARMSGDLFNTWSRVSHGDPPVTVGFKDGHLAGWGTETGAIHAALLATLTNRR